MKIFILILGLMVPGLSFAQSYSIGWHTIAGGGGTSTNGQYSLSGTIGQPDAGGPVSGGGYSVTGGFWAFASAIQTAGAPYLYISQSANTVMVFWQNVPGWNLQQNSNLAASAGWTPNNNWTTSNGTNYLNLPMSTGDMFFRLYQP